MVTTHTEQNVPTGGAFVSLDPWSREQTDTTVWIANTNKQYFTPALQHTNATGLLVVTIPPQYTSNRCNI